MVTPDRIEKNWTILEQLGETRSNYDELVMFAEQNTSDDLKQCRNFLILKRKEATRKYRRHEHMLFSELQGEEGMLYEPPSDCNVYAEVERNEVINAIRAAIVQLDQKSQAVVSLYYYKDQTLQQIAAALSTNLTDVHNCLKKAEATLKPLLIQYKPGSGRENNYKDLPLFAEVA
ncbi:MAG: RNA polymerase sigma factor [Nitrospirota bacterium]